jgi:biofilm protein TabA
MILDSLNNAATYRCLGERFQSAFHYLAGFDPTTPDGRYEIAGTDLYSLVQTYESDPPEKRTFESHRNYADIQFLLSGREEISYCPSSALIEKVPYDPVKDVTFYEDCPARPLYLQSGEFVVLWPQDGHKPGCLWEKSCPVRKVVLKVRLDVA